MRQITKHARAQDINRHLFNDRLVSAGTEKDVQNLSKEGQSMNGTNHKTRKSANCKTTFNREKGPSGTLAAKLVQRLAEHTKMP